MAASRSAPALLLSPGQQALGHIRPGVGTHVMPFAKGNMDAVNHASLQVLTKASLRAVVPFSRALIKAFIPISGLASGHMRVI